jgi:DNA mismatch repair protein MutL
MRTRRETDELAVLLKVEASELKAQENIAGPKGTNILVKNLFYNVPARRNFLKSNPIEMRHVIDEFQRVALANPEVGFSLHHNDAEVYSLPAGKLSRRIVDLFGKQYREQLGACQEETPFINVSGYIGRPASAKKTRGEQFFYANNRFIKHHYLHHAVLSVFEGLIPEGTHPFYVLFIEIDPVHIDINVHPTKTEIKFDDERSVYAIVQAAVRKAMNTYNLGQSIDFDADVNVNFGFNNSSFGQNKFDSELPARSEATSQTTPRARINLSNWAKLYDGLSADFENQPKQTQKPGEAAWKYDWGSTALPTFEAETEPEVEQGIITFQSKANRLEATQATEYQEYNDRSCYQIHNRYIVSQHKDGLLLIDQRAAYERILYDRYSSTFNAKNGLSQQLLFPKTLKFNPADYHLITEIKDEIGALGFVFDLDADEFQIIIHGVPSDMQDENEQNILEGLLEQIKFFSNDLKISQREKLARSFAKRAASNYQIKLSLPEMNMLIDQLLDSSNPSLSPSGEPTMNTLSLEKLALLLA